jgi:hypothetical protein
VVGGYDDTLNSVSYVGSKWAPVWLSMPGVGGPCNYGFALGRFLWSRILLGMKSHLTSLCQDFACPSGQRGIKYSHSE